MVLGFGQITKAVLWQTLTRFQRFAIKKDVSFYYTAADDVMSNKTFYVPSNRIRVRHSAGHHGEGGAEQLAGERHLRGKLQ